MAQQVIGQIEADAKIMKKRDNKGLGHCHMIGKITMICSWKAAAGHQGLDQARRKWGKDYQCKRFYNH